jgi:hypothetical protein
MRLCAAHRGAVEILVFGGGMVVAVGQLAKDVSNDFRGTLGVQVFFHAAQGDADHVPMMQLGAGALLAELEPETVDEVDIFGPETGRMRAEVEKDDIFLILENDFER